MDLSQIWSGQQINPEETSSSVWASFADIMTNVVMIFLLTLSVVVLRNYELIASLQSTLEARNRSEAHALDESKKNRALEDQLADLKAQLDRLLLALAEKDTQISALNQDMTLNQEEQARLSSKLLEALLTVTQIEAEKKDLEGKMSVLDVLLSSETDYSKTLLEQMKAKEMSFSELKEKYDKLIRPARSELNKQVAVVRYRIVAGSPDYEIIPPKGAPMAHISEATLHEFLAALKERYGKDLYVKVVFPEGSNVSHDKAWNFTQDLLNRYDYYYQ